MTSHPAAEAFGATLTPGTRPTVLAVDLMRAYFDPASPLNLPDDGCLHSAARVLEAARAHDVPVVHTRVSYGPGGLDGGVFFRKVPALAQLVGDSPMGELMPEVAPRGDEVVVVKQYASAFFGTTLATTLHARGIDTVVVVGVSTSGCIRATVVDAIQHGFVPLVVEDAVGDRAPEPHWANLHDLRTKYAEVVDEPTAITYLEGTS
ncbi:N-carbamoylsarcosine amidase [Nocardioides flavus (ex Wang et al. 2016)]|uniref:N-carbamoylsarcosine amidase n=1 Tax=Nocardioides flavus (ex Wang et al. 2016) TaxID=2058780 RepID=A0ABQ3HJR9_9ACTN|nr:isochorismatase family protein [Nocardioides flavus (ex Wang et al. 2016)]GHE17511.1 N-carbamoylsarcosine amidase [Nocardioides flavus (ex Wang et al. 2016)]